MGPQPESKEEPLFFKILHRLIDCGYLKVMTGPAVKVYLALKRHADKNGLCYPGLPALSSETGLNRKTVQRAVRELKPLKLAETKRTSARYKFKTLYRVLDPQPSFTHCIKAIRRPKCRPPALRPTDDLSAGTEDDPKALSAPLHLGTFDAPCTQTNRLPKKKKEVDEEDSPPTPSPAPTSPQGSNGAEGEDKTKAYFRRQHEELSASMEQEKRRRWTR